MFPASCRFPINRTSAFIAGSKKNLVDQPVAQEAQGDDRKRSKNHAKISEHRKIRPWGPRDAAARG